MGKPILMVGHPWGSRAADEIKMPLVTFERKGSEVRAKYAWDDGTIIIQKNPADLASRCLWTARSERTGRDIPEISRSTRSMTAPEVALELATMGYGPGARNVRYVYPYDTITLSSDELCWVWESLSDTAFQQIIRDLESPPPWAFDFQDGSEVISKPAAYPPAGTRFPVVSHTPTIVYEVRTPKGPLRFERTPSNMSDCVRQLSAKGFGPVRDPRYCLDFANTIYTRIGQEAHFWTFPDDSVVYLLINKQYPFGAWFARESIQKPSIVRGQGYDDHACPARWVPISMLVERGLGPVRRFSDEQRSLYIGRLKARRESVQQTVEAVYEGTIYHPALVFDNNLPLAAPTPVAEPPQSPAEPPTIIVNGEIGSDGEHPIIHYPKVDEGTDEDEGYETLLDLPILNFRGPLVMALKTMIGQMDQAISGAIDLLDAWDDEVLEQRIAEQNPEAGMVERFTIKRVLANLQRMTEAYKIKYDFPRDVPIMNFENSEPNKPTAAEEFQHAQDVVDQFAMGLIMQIKSGGSCPVCKDSLQTSSVGTIRCPSCQYVVTPAMRNFAKTQRFKYAYSGNKTDYLRTLLKASIYRVKHAIRHEQEKGWMHEFDICGEDLNRCSVCGGAEATLPKHCPGRKLTVIELDGIQTGRWDYIKGEFVRTGN